ncbi:MAG: dipeptide/oligopeptide/nickel ABC transporter ATP-binding protein [Thermotoga sp. 4484_232]|nr:MAG: dipeptide/oligopeptide/nickel ABC transporter ATP-binding protein [Thermotoga sp. 4484_232]RKX56160.1 MAG: ABC transporter ATP-binding protein [Thermotoga sp.]HDG61878.1 ABC transporter ATP-binding protein [Thermotoga sp.]
MSTVLSVEKLKVYYRTEKGLVRAVDNVTFSINEEETIGLVGESGCGKSTLGSTLLKILPNNAIVEGKIFLNGEEIVSKPEKEMQKIRGVKVSMIFQDPMTSLNPIMKIEDHFIETILTHRPDLTRDEAMEMAIKALESVGIDKSRIRDYPFQFSGGMRQRVMIALAIVLNPVMLIADEPTTSLDVIVQAQILELLKDLKNKYKMSMLLITHDLGVVAEMADRIGVMYAGHLVELGKSEKIYYEPKHPYTKALLESIPNTNVEDRELRFIPGSPPDLVDPPKGCRFAPRCQKARKICWEKEPPIFDVDGTQVKCWIYEEGKGGTT